MDFLIKKEIEWNKFELEIDANIFSKEIILRTAYIFIDKWYFLFFSKWNNIIVQCQKKDNTEETSEKIILDFTDELLNTYLRDKVEKENRNLREIIINKALTSPIDSENYVIDSNNEKSEFENEIESILKSLEDDPELNIDWDEMKKLIEKIKEE